MFRINSIRTKFQIYLAILILFILIISNVIILQFIGFFIDGNQKEISTVWIKDFESLTEPNFVFYNYMNLLSQAEEILREKKDDFIIMYNSHKKEIIHRGVSFPDREKIQFADNIQIQPVKINKIPYYLISIPVKVQNSDTIWGYIFYGSSLKGKIRLMSTIRQHYIFLSVALFIISIIVLHIIIKHTMKPIHELKKGFEAASQGDLSYRIKLNSKDEYAFLADKFNEMCSKLKDIIIEHEDSQKDLENQIKDRTQTLNITNNKLQKAMEELKRTQNHIIQTEKQKSLAAIVSGFAHEINNPLTGILGYIDLMELRNELSPYIKKKLGEIKYQSNRIRDIINELNQLNPASNQTKLEINLPNLLDKLTKILKTKNEHQKITFVSEFAEDNITVVGNHFSLWQVFEGIIENSIEAILNRNPDKGLIIIKVKKSIDDSWAIIEIIDNGGGFENIDKAFDPFYTTKNRTIKKGIGLSISYNLIHEQKGNIVINNNDEGATVTVLLPLNRENLK
jgi:signal transduction histidine kinase